MSQIYNGGYVSVHTAGAYITTGAASQNVALPTDSSGGNPRYIRVSASAAAYVRLGKDNTVAATANDMMVQPGDAVIMAVANAGETYIAALQVSAAGKVQISALDNI